MSSGMCDTVFPKMSVRVFRSLRLEKRAFVAQRALVVRVFFLGRRYVILIPPTSLPQIRTLLFHLNALQNRSSSSINQPDSFPRVPRRAKSSLIPCALQARMCWSVEISLIAEQADLEFMSAEYQIVLDQMDRDHRAEMAERNAEFSRLLQVQRERYRELIAERDAEIARLAALIEIHEAQIRVLRTQDRGPQESRSIWQRCRMFLNSILGRCSRFRNTREPSSRNPVVVQSNNETQQVPQEQGVVKRGIQFVKQLFHLMQRRDQ